MMKNVPKVLSVDKKLISNGKNWTIVEKNWKPETPEQLTKLKEEFASLNNPTKEDFEHALAKVSEELNVGKGKLIHPLRLAVSGQSTGPGMFDLLFILGKDEIIKRIDSAIKKIKYNC